MKLLQILILMLVLLLTSCIDDRNELQIRGVLNVVVDDGSCSVSEDAGYKSSGILDITNYLRFYTNFNYDYILDLVISNNMIMSEEDSNNDELRLRKGITITGASVDILYKGRTMVRTEIDQESFFLGSSKATYQLSIKDVFRKVLYDAIDNALPAGVNELDTDGNGIIETENITPENVQLIWEEFQTAKSRKQTGHYLMVYVTLKGKRVVDGSAITSNKFAYRIEVVTDELARFYYGDAAEEGKTLSCSTTCSSTPQDFSFTCTSN